MARNASNTKAADPSAQPAGPIGERMGRAAGPSHLYPEGGREARKSGESVFCGRIAGEAVGYREHPNSKDPSKMSTVFSGRFLFIDNVGKQTMHSDCYLPGVFGNGLRAQLSRPNADMVGFVIEVWAEPDEVTGRKSAIGYEYAVYDRTQRQGPDPLLLMAGAAGIIPMPALPAPTGPRTDVDPETGEVIHPSARTA